MLPGVAIATLEGFGAAHQNLGATPWLPNLVVGGGFVPLQPPRRKVGESEGRMCVQNVEKVSDMHEERGRGRRGRWV